MKKLYKFYSDARVVITSLVLVLSFSQAQAGEEKYNWYVTDAVSYPTGGGTVYLAEEETGEADRTYTAQKELQTCDFSASNSRYFYGYAKPNDSYIFVGWKTLDPTYYDDVIDDSSVKMADYLSTGFVSYLQDDAFYLSTTATTDNNTVESYSYVPDNTLVAMFGHIALRYVSGQNDLGTMEVEDPATEIGEFTYITATPNDSLHASFKYWLDEDGKIYSKNARCEVNVTKNMILTAVFEAPNYETIDFGEGGYKVVSSIDYDVDYDNAVVSHTFLTPQVMSTYQQTVGYDTIPGYREVEKDTVAADGLDTIIMVQVPDTQYVPIVEHIAYEVYPSSFTGSQYITDTCTYSYGFAAGDAVLLYGKGLTTIHYVEKSAYTASVEQNKLVAAGENGTDIASLPQDGVKYYVFDEKTNTFNAVTSGTVPAGSGYLVITDDMNEYKFDTLYFVSAYEYAEKINASCDVNHDGNIDIEDVAAIYEAMESGKTEGMDVNGDGVVDTQDVIVVFKNFDEVTITEE